MMKVVLFLVGVGAMGWVDVLASESAVALYNRGNEQYRAGHFQAAISAYQRVIAEGLHNGEVYYNLGNAYFKNGQLGRAILSYERALKLMPRDEDVLANLRFANARKVDRETENEENVATRILQAMFRVFLGRYAGGSGLRVCLLFGRRRGVLDFCAHSPRAVGRVAGGSCGRAFGQCGHARVEGPPRSPRHCAGR